MSLGPSPLARGSLPWCVTGVGRPGSIPARAGQPLGKAPRRVPSRVHPRSRGAAPRVAGLLCTQPGPSPLARGSHHASRVEHNRRGSIPARAGQPCLLVLPHRTPRVHPRSRGAASAASANSHVITGPSPLARGSHRAHGIHQHRVGSIPARAGQPRRCSWSTRRTRVHPRSRGAAY